MKLRRAIAGDAPACAAIVARWIDATDWMPDGPSEAELEALMRDGFPRREAWVAESDGAIAGYLSMRAEEDHIVGLYADRPGHGTGRALIDRVKADRDRLQLNSHAPNAAAHRFYEREGFRITATDLPGEDGVPEIRMEWSR
ncbi:GNAT family N-acetyltransferase [uncultured Jannaschia sp.]|uniref:GNAT family N-acetyltransferase n=1 Tax=uncultured Jannaschia sp. TaxID=293347 RepID=UPI002634481D|nr:GNAT family N-acetyltransferase [uncultured Jannaschia sp.]